MASQGKEKKSGLHPRNRHRNGYDFKALVVAHPPLGDFVQLHAGGRPTIDYADANAVKALNKALLLDAYKLDYWDIPDGYLCPPVPGRTDYIHHLADLLAGSNQGRIPVGPQLRLLDIGTGANTIYPIVGVHEYGWSFAGADTDRGALASAKAIMANNITLKDRLELRFQAHRESIFENVIHKEDLFDATMCNPPFFASQEESDKAGRRKFRNLGRREPERDMRNFSGSAHELHTPGGELAFIKRMVDESRNFKNQVLWFTSLVSRKENLPAIYNAFDKFEAVQVKTIPMSQGLKSSRFVAWTFLNAAQHIAWSKHRFPPK